VETLLLAPFSISSESDSTFFQLISHLINY